jgi:Cu-Zn family superoxide dismutase
MNADKQFFRATSRRAVQWSGAVLLALLAGCSPPPASLDRESAASNPEGDAPPPPEPGEIRPDRFAAVAPADGEVPRNGSRDEVVAMLQPTAGNSVTGMLRFRPADDGTLAIHAEIAGLTPGSHGLHIHEIGDCAAPDAASAGDHFNSDGDPHGAPDAGNDAHHAGDLGNIVADSTGKAVQDWRDEELALSGQYGVVGRAVIVHAGEDDLTSQPSGNSGPRVACGVVWFADGTAPQSAGTAARSDSTAPGSDVTAPPPPD